MSHRQREVAKFFAGAFAYDAVMHLMLALSDVLPLTFLRVVTLTPGLNAAALIAAAAMALSLAYYGWLQPRRR